MKTAVEPRPDTAPGPRTAAPSAAARWWRGTPGLLVGLTVVCGFALALRLAGVMDRGIGIDEPTIVLPAVEAAQGRISPPTFAYPPLPAYLLAVVLRIGEPFSPGLIDHPVNPYLAARLLFALVSTAVVAVTGLLAAAVAPASQRRLYCWGAAATLAVSYVAVRLGNVAKPDELQNLFVVGSVLAAVMFARSGRRGWLLAAGAAAGLAAATKYVGGVVVLVAVAAALWPRPDQGGRRLRNATAAVGASVAGFLAGTLGTVVTAWPRFWEGFTGELGHQAGGHLGYEPQGPGWWFQLAESLPGTVGWPLALLAVAGVVLALVRGSRPQRLVAGAAVAALAIVGLSAVRFPHYLLLALPFLIVAAWMAVGALARRLPRAAALCLVAVAGLSLLVPLTDDLRLIRVASVQDATAEATAAALALGAPVHAEAYSVDHTVAAQAVFSWEEDPQIVDCGCIVAVSSHQEQRYRRRPDLYPDEIAVYDALRAEGEVVGVFGREQPLPYNWDLLPQWGLRQIPLTGPVGAVGPTVTLLDLR